MINIKIIKTFFKPNADFFSAWLIKWGIPLVIVASYCFLSFQPDLRKSVHVLIGGTAFITILITILLYSAESRRIYWSPAVIISLAAIIRILFLFRPPELSDDIFRYLWDGLQIVNGHNPYSLAPSDVRPGSGIYNGLLAHINHPRLVTIYPPAAELTFAAGAAFGGKITGLKALFTVVDVATCVLILVILSTLKLPLSRGILYAWHPLPVIEISSSGHIDGTGICLFLLALFLLMRQSPVHMSTGLKKSSENFSKGNIPSLVSGLTFACSVLVKFFPAVFTPGLIIFAKKKMKIFFSLGLLAGLAALLLPFSPEIIKMSATLGIYLNNWEFSGFLFRVLRDLTSSGKFARFILLFLFIATVTIIYLQPICTKNRGYYSGNSDDVLPLIKTFYFISIAFLLLTTTLYPWYAIPLAALLPFNAGPAGLVLSWTVFLSYRILIAYAYTGQWIEEDIIPAVIFLAPLTASLIFLVARKTKAYTDKHF